MRTQKDEAPGSTSMLTAMLAGAMPAMPIPEPGAVSKLLNPSPSPPGPAKMSITPIVLRLRLRAADKIWTLTIWLT